MFQIGPCAGYAYPAVSCVGSYGTLLAEPFHRPIRTTIGFNDQWSDTVAPNDPSLSVLNETTFVVFNEALAKSVLGPSPTLDLVANLSLVGHEAPVYVPDLNKLYFSQLGNVTFQWVLDLNASPYNLSKQTTDPPLKCPTGATYHNGSILWSGSSAPDGGYFHAALHAQDPRTGKLTTLMNNYFGYAFNTIDDLAVAPNGDIWFTDDWYAYAISGIDTGTPQLEPALWRFEVSTGRLSILDDTLQQPNGIAFAPDGRTVYVTDTSTDDVSIVNRTSTYKPYMKRTVYAYDIVGNGTGVARRRAIYLASDRIPDGIKVAANGYIATATGQGVDVITPEGVLVVRIVAPFTIVNLVFGGKGYEDLFLIGVAGVFRVRFGLRGYQLT